MTGRRLIGAAIAVLVGAGGGWLALGRDRPAGPRSASATAGETTLATARVTRRDLVTTDRVDGTLGYAPSAPVVNRLSGTYTALPAEGTIVPPGAVLYSVDAQPVLLLRGDTPAWRPFAANMADGPDVAQLEQGLIAVGAGRGLVARPDQHFDAATANAISRWQRMLGLVGTGSLELGRVVFLPASVRVGQHRAEVGANASPGQPPFDTTSGARSVTVALAAQKQDEATVGAPVSIELANRTLPGHITSVGKVASTGATAHQDGAPPAPTVTMIVAPDDPAATGDVDQAPVSVLLTVASHRDVLSVPITALLAVGEDGEAVEVVEPGEHHRTVPVTTGVAAGGYVEVSGRGIADGTVVVVAL